jgi:cytochrome oxidase Cu insertion factor (SCO1/SenC/PrrC family)
MSLRTKTAAVSALALFCLATLASAQAPAKKTEAAKPALKLNVGDLAPDFTLKTMTSDGLKDVSLHDYKGKKNVVLAFYVFAFTGG